MWFDDMDIFHDGYAKVRLNNKWNFVDTNGKLISDTWFDDAYDFYDGYTYVLLNNKWYGIDTNGKLYYKRPK